MPNPLLVDTVKLKKAAEEIDSKKEHLSLEEQVELDDISTKLSSICSKVMERINKSISKGGQHGNA